MAKVKVKPLPGALEKLLNGQGKTQQDLSAEGISRGTLRRINKGLPVKQETLRRVATLIRIPAEHFLPNSSEATTKSDEIQICNEEKRNYETTIDLKRLRNYDDIFNEMIFTRSIKWNLSHKLLTDEMTELLYELEKKIEKLHKDILPSDKLSEQIENLKRINTLDEILKKLSNHKLFLYGASYLKWTSRTEEEVFTQYYVSTTFKYMRFSSETIFSLHIEKEDKPSIRNTIFTGTPPPKIAPPGEIIYIVNGRTLPTEEIEPPF